MVSVRLFVDWEQLIVIPIEEIIHRNRILSFVPLVHILTQFTKPALSVSSSSCISYSCHMFYSFSVKYDVNHEVISAEVSCRGVKCAIVGNNVTKYLQHDT